MSQHAEMPALTWSELGVSELLPTGTVTLLLADVEGSTRLWETQPGQMTAALAALNRTVDETVAAYDGVRPVEQGEGDSFVAAFARASDAVGCALALQRAPLAPIKLRIGLHTGEIQLRDEGNYTGPTINRTARIRDLAHGGQTVLSGVTESLVVDRLPDGVWLTDLGSYPLRGVPRPERVVQLCHPELRNEFPPLRVRTAVASHNIPAQLTSFVGRQREMAELRRLVADNRLVTLTGAGGAGKTRLAVEVASQLGAEFTDGLWYVDLAPINNAAAVPVTVARTLGLPDQPGRSTIELLGRFFAEKTMLMLLDNCEHLLDACGGMVVDLLRSCPQLTVLTTSREPLGVPGEMSWRVPSLAVADEAVELFSDRARRARPDFVVDQANSELVGEICARLDGMPLAIELAAARTRALSLTQILNSLHDRFRLLTGGARTAVRRQQTLRASVDWSHALLTDPERILFRRLAVFSGGFDLDAAQAVGASNEVEGYQLLDQLTLLVDKSLVVADDTAGGMRYRLLETVRHYAQEKLGESGEADEVRTRHRDYYVGTALRLALAALPGDQPLLDWAPVEIDNLRTAFVWCRENGDPETALRLLSSLQQFWLRSGRLREALTGFDAVLAEVRPGQVAPSVWVWAVGDRSTLALVAGLPADPDVTQEALAIARQLGDPMLIAQALAACGMLAYYDSELGQPYLTEAIEFARARGDRWRLCQLLAYQTSVSVYDGDLLAARAFGEEGREIADALGDRFTVASGGVWLCGTLAILGEFPRACAIIEEILGEVERSVDLTLQVYAHTVHANVLAFQGEADAAGVAAQAALVAAESVGGYFGDAVYAVLAHAAVAAGDTVVARQASQASWQQTDERRQAFLATFNPLAEAALAAGDLVAAREWADRTVALVPGGHQVRALTIRACVAAAQGDLDQAERDAHDALAVATRTQAFMRVPQTFECLARLTADAGNPHYATRLSGAAHAMRQRMAQRRFPMYEADYEATVTTLRQTLGATDFNSAWADGSALSVEEAIAYAQRGRGERRRPTSGWGSLTPTELDVVRLVREGLGNKEVGARLFISPRTVQSHLTHVYAKLGLESRVQLVQEAGQHV
ncbi:LuxR family transcriptional regulator [Mycobacterium intermedium]|uniref:LuxR family transcriptional regulator n=2 Tax=Mycobacterium intermedium TaxID=28445 RepID=A0A1E3SH24_MYCIE|nr:LuxR family transcriptional regulator [Mycobacterium intermedium]ODR01466.1 transcriptional regulator [Mycobacterium intermedium]ORB01234.1 LuxR family transcriptional regulator [Mycobacterium intermedium]